MKKKWEYKYPERLVQAMVSEDYVLIGEQLYFVHMTNGSYPKAGIYCVDVNSVTDEEIEKKKKGKGACCGDAVMFAFLIY